MVLGQSPPHANSTCVEKHGIHLHLTKVDILVDIFNILPHHDKPPLIMHLPQVILELTTS
jgi:hypothetical protein